MNEWMNQSMNDLNEWINNKQQQKQQNKANTKVAFVVWNSRYMCTCRCTVIITISIYIAKCWIKLHIFHSGLYKSEDLHIIVHGCFCFIWTLQVERQHRSAINVLATCSIINYVYIYAHILSKKCLMTLYHQTECN